MAQLLTLIWLKWRLLRNSLRSSRAVINNAASILGMLIALALSLLVALILGVVSYAISQPEALSQAFRRTAVRELPGSASTEFIFFSMIGVIYLMWATVPLSIGGNKQFDAGKLLMYPITLRKLFAVDFISELTTLHSVFAIPAVLAICIGTGLGTGNLTLALISAVPILLFGVALSKWLSTIIASLVRRKRAKGETIVALIGAVAGLAGAVVGQVAPMLFKHAESFRSLRWTPPGAAAVLLVGSAEIDLIAYGGAFLTLSAYGVTLIVATYWIARRAALGLGGRQKRKAAVVVDKAGSYSGWQLPLISSELSAIVEKELRYAMRNAQVRMMALMPLIVIFFRALNSRRWGAERPAGPDEFITYASGLIATGGLLYVFLILAALFCNNFAFDEGGMRTLILSPIDRRKVLLGKNIAITLIALVFSLELLILNTIVFGDLSGSTLLFLVLSFIISAAIASTIGNWLSIRFPKRMRFGKRLNLSGVASLFLIPTIIMLMAPAIIATFIGYFSRSILNEYLAMLVLTLLAVGMYFVVIRVQGRTFERREIEILEAVREPVDE